MGQNESNPVRNMDKRTARREHRDPFSSAISSYRYRRLGEDEVDNGGMIWETGDIRVCVRKRPIFKEEISNYEFDVITCVNRQTVVVHDARMHSDMKRMCLKHYEFKFDRIFNEKTNNDEVYLETAAPMTQFAIEGGFATCLMYGQTGSGDFFPPPLLTRRRENVHYVLDLRTCCSGHIPESSGRGLLHLPLLLRDLR
jgi:hypothetical protein